MLLVNLNILVWGYHWVLIKFKILLFLNKISIYILLENAYFHRLEINETLEYHSFLFGIWNSLQLQQLIATIKIAICLFFDSIYCPILILKHNYFFIFLIYIYLGLSVQRYYLSHTEEYQLAYNKSLQQWFFSQ